MTKAKREAFLARIAECETAIGKAESCEKAGCKCRWCEIGDEDCYRGWFYRVWPLLVNIRDELKGKLK